MKKISLLLLIVCIAAGTLALVQRNETTDQSNEDQVKTLRKMVAFQAQSEEVEIIAAKDGTITSVNSEVGLIGWDESLVGRSIHELRPQHRREIHGSQVNARIEEGGTGRIHSFESQPCVTQEGEIILVDGYVFWNEDSQELFGFFRLAE